MKNRGKRKDFEIVFYEKLVEQRPNFVQALFCLGDAYTRRGFYHEGLEVDKKLAKVKPEDPTVYYNLACSFSLLGEVETALNELKKAILLGYDDFSYILEDPDLAQLRESAKFKEFFRKVEKIDTRSS